MPEPIAYLRGQWIPASQAAVPVYDAGFVLGATVTEQLRTFRGELFRLPEHLERLRASLELSGIEPQESLSDLADIAVRLVSQNFALVDSNDDLGLVYFRHPWPVRRDGGGRSVAAHRGFAHLPTAVSFVVGNVPNGRGVADDGDPADSGAHRCRRR